MAKPISHFVTRPARRDGGDVGDRRCLSMTYGDPPVSPECWGDEQSQEETLK